MKQRKRLIATLLSLALLLSLLLQISIPASAETYSGECGENLTWSFDNATGVLTIIGSGDMWDFDFQAPSVDTVPWSSHRYDIKEVELSNSLTGIGDYAFFSCSYLKNIIIPNSVRHIGDSAFSGCYELRSITLPNSIDKISYSMLDGCHYLNNVTIPESVTSIEDYAFYYCESLTTITIPDSVTSIGELAFYGTSLTNVTIPGNVVSIGARAFGGQDGKLTSIVVSETNPVYSDSDGILFSKDRSELIQYTKANSVEYTIPDGIVSIGAYAFSFCALQSVTLPSSVTSIGDGAFNNCSSLMSLTIPDGVTSIGSSTFEFCEALSSISIPDSVTGIGKFAFFYCSSLERITIPGSVTAIELGAFDRTSLKVVYYSGSQADWDKIDIQDYNDPLYSATIHYNSTDPCTDGHDFDMWKQTIAPTCTVKGKEARTCSRCGEMETRMLAALGHNYVNGFCLICGAAEGSGGEGIRSGECGENLIWAFDEATGMLTIYGSGDMWDYYLDSPSWSTYSETISAVQLPNGLTSIGSSAFSGCRSLASVTIPNGVASIGDWAFDVCESQLNVYYGGSKAEWDKVDISSYGNDPLLNATIHYNSAGSCTDGHDFGSWTQTKAPTCIENGKEARVCSRCGERETREIEALGHNFVNGVCSICGTTESSGGQETHSGKCGDNLTWQFDPETGILTITGIGDMWDYRPEYAPWCIYQNILALQLTDGITSIGEYAFSHCSSLTNVTIPDSVTSIGDWAFFDCGSLTSVSIPNSVTSIGSGVFYHCSSLTSVTIPNSVTFISYGVFSDCSALTSITIPNGVTSIGSEVFLGCASLTGVTIPGSVTSIDEYAFNGCDSLTDVYYSGNKAEWDRIDIGDGNDPLLNATIHYNSGGASTEPVSFTDVPAKAFYAGAVSWAVASNITNGTGDGKFSPNDTCTRGQVVTFLWRACGQPEPTNKNNPFADVEQGKYYYNAVLWAVENGITSGTEPGRFSPNGECTRGQVVTFLWRAAGKPASVGSDPQIAPQNPFTDVKEGAYYYNAVLWAVGQGVTNGTSDTTFSPNATCTRGQVVTFLFRNLK